MKGGDALAVRGVTAGYGRTTVLRDISLTVPTSSVVAIVGPNGAGKTTTLRVVAGLVKPQSGRVLVGDEDVTRLSPAQRSRAGICLIPEGRGVFPNLTVRENLRLQVPPWRSGASFDAAVDAFPVLGQRMDQSAGSLSGGQQQMLAVARAFLAEPSVAVLDEVSMGLAPKVIDHIYAGLRKLTASGIALLLVEQYVARALEMADRVVLLDRGTVSFDGPASALDEGTIMSSYLHAASADPDSSAANSLPTDKSLSHQETLPHEKTLC